MGLEYIRSIHGVLNALLVVSFNFILLLPLTTMILQILSSFAIFVGHGWLSSPIQPAFFRYSFKTRFILVVWNHGDVYFLFILYGWPLVTMALVFLTIVWFTSIVL